jgi:hypothetical protein
LQNKHNFCFPANIKREDFTSGENDKLAQQYEPAQLLLQRLRQGMIAWMEDVEVIKDLNPPPAHLFLQV